MAAGLGFKNFSTGDVLTAADTNGYLMQGVWVFANAAARDAAVTSPQEGNMCFLKDSDVTQYYTGSAWTSSSGGMTLLSTTTLSGTSTSVSVSATGYKNLVAYIYGAQAAVGFNYNVRINSITAATYNNMNTSTIPAGTRLNTGGDTSAIDLNQPGNMSLLANNALNAFNLTFWDCNSTQKKLVTVNGTYVNNNSVNVVMNNIVSVLDATSAITNITVIANQSLTSGTIQVYGVK